jgi:hypothetical protein
MLKAGHGFGTLGALARSAHGEVESAEELARTLAKKRTLNWFVRG